jgi:hypothetical protein
MYALNAIETETETLVNLLTILSYGPTVVIGISFMTHLFLGFNSNFRFELSVKVVRDKGDLTRFNKKSKFLNVRQGRTFDRCTGRRILFGSGQAAKITWGFAPQTPITSSTAGIS